MEDRSLTDAETAVPEDERPAARCPYCAVPFQSERDRDLHVGDAHRERCTAAERDAYEAADEAEVHDLFYFHLKVVMALGAIYSVTVLAYMVVLS